MEFLKKTDCKGEMLPGRIISKVVGKDSPIVSERMSVGFAKYCKEAGTMQPHKHAEETVYIVDAVNAWMRYGDTNKCEKGKIDLENGMMIRYDEDEWHVFEYEEGGHLEIIFIYGQADNLRPEQKK